MIAPIGKFTLFLTVLAIPTAVVQSKQTTPAQNKSAQNKSATNKSAAPGIISADKKLLGSWQPKGGGKPIVYLPHGIGKNADGSRFTWHMEGNYLVAQALSVDGIPAGNAVRIPLLFTRDGKEYATFLEGGKLKSPFYHLLANGKIDAHREQMGGDYPPDKFLPKKEDDEENTPPPARPLKHTQKPIETPPKQTDKPAAMQTSPEKIYSTSGIHVGPNVQVSTAWPRVLHAEVTMAADPVHADWLLAASMFSPPPHDAAAPKVIVYASRDRGKTWKVSLTRNNPNPQTYADPAFAYGPEGSLYFVNMYWPSLDALQGRSLQFTRTNDGGRTWSAMTQIPGFHDRPFLAVDATNGSHNGWLYCTDGYPDKSVFVSKDRAKMFLPASVWSARPSEAVFSGNSVVTADGSLVLLYTTVPGPVGGATSAGKKARGVDSDEVQKPTVSGQTTTCSVAIVRSQDGGVSFEEAKQIAEYRDGEGPGGLPMLALDTSRSVYTDRLYAVWVDMLASGSRVMLASSKDGGKTWSQPALLSEQDEDVTSKSGSGRMPNTSRSYEAFLPSVAVNKAGVVGVSWYDTRGLPPRRPGWNLRFRTSLDGGNTWRPSVQVTDVATLFKERKKPFSRHTQGLSIQPGHTAGLAADAGGVFHPLWIDRRTGILQVFTADVTVAGNP